MGWVTGKSEHELYSFLCVSKTTASPLWTVFFILYVRLPMPLLLWWLEIKHSALCRIAPFPAIKATTGTVKSFLVQLLVKNIQLEDGKMIPASHIFRGEDNTALELTKAELVTMEAVRVRDHFRATVWLCTAHGFCESHFLESSYIRSLWMYVLALGTVFVLSCFGLFMFSCPFFL